MRKPLSLPPDFNNISRKGWVSRLVLGLMTHKI